MDNRTHALKLTVHITRLMSQLESAHKCCFNEINLTFAEIERSVIKASDSNNVGKLLFYSNLIAKSVDEVCHE